MSRLKYTPRKFSYNTSTHTTSTTWYHTPEQVAKRKTYSDKFKAGAITLLVSEGYPSDVYALEKVARHLNVPGRTLRRWFNGEHGQPPVDVVTEVKKELSEIFEDEIRALMDSLSDVRDEASLKDRVMSAAILFDKRQLLLGKPTERSEQHITATVDLLEEMKSLTDDDLRRITDAGSSGLSDISR